MTPQRQQMGGRSRCADECHEGDESGIGNSEARVGAREAAAAEEKESNGRRRGCNTASITEKMK